MPTKRRRIAHRKIGLSQDAIEAWRIGDSHALNRALGIRPWEISPFDADLLADAPEGRARELREALLRHGPPGKVGRHGEPLGPAASEAEGGRQRYAD